MKIAIRKRTIKNNFFKALVTAFVILCLLPLIYILWYILRQGLPVINWHFLTHIPMPVGETGGGIVNALLGSLLIILCATIIAVPLGVTAGTYLSENENTRLAYWCRFSADILQGIPSIVIGIVIYFWMVKPMKSFSAISGSVALAMMMIPIIVRSTEETVKLLPYTLKEASLALGVSYQRTILKVLLPCSLSGIISGILLSIARIAGETAPLLFTAFGNPYLSANIFKPMHSLPLLIYNYAISPYNDWHDLAWGASLILLLWILILNIITKLATKKWNIQF